ncbi:MAG: hypothetical protein VB031_04420 [Eubacteriaceae bacterium]|nr:hypothetical protein [Eubacteriaceae bacterium]
MYKRYFQSKKNLCLFVILFLVLLLCASTVSAYAYTTNSVSQKVDISYKVYGGIGQSNGKKNGVYHKLKKGTAYLHVSSTNGNSKVPMTVYLYRDRTGPDKDCGHVRVKKATRYSFTVDSNSSKYYIVATGGQYETMNLKGKINNSK